MRGRISAQERPCSHIPLGRTRRAEDRRPARGGRRTPGQVSWKTL